jgi:hypothetical protein
VTLVPVARAAWPPRRTQQRYALDELLLPIPDHVQHGPQGD